MTQQETRVVTIGALKVAYRVTSDETDDALGIYEMTLAPHTIGATPHIHRVLTEVFHILDGKLELLVSEREVVANSGDVVLVPPRTVHAFANRGDRPVVFMLTFAPALRREGFFEGLAALHDADRMTDEAAVLDVLRRFDQEPVEGPANWTRG